MKKEKLTAKLKNLIYEYNQNKLARSYLPKKFKKKYADYESKLFTERNLLARLIEAEYKLSVKVSPIEDTLSHRYGFNKKEEEKYNNTLVLVKDTWIPLSLEHECRRQNIDILESKEYFYNGKYYKEQKVKLPDYECSITYLKRTTKPTVELEIDKPYSIGDYAFFVYKKTSKTYQVKISKIHLEIVNKVMSIV